MKKLISFISRTLKIVLLIIFFANCIVFYQIYNYNKMYGAKAFPDGEYWFFYLIPIFFSLLLYFLYRVVKKIYDSPAPVTTKTHEG